MFITDIRINNMKLALEMCTDDGITNILGLDTVGGSVCEYVCTYQVRSAMGSKYEQVRVNTYMRTIEPVSEHVASEGSIDL